MAHESPGKSAKTASGVAEAETQIMFSVRCGSNCALIIHGPRKGLTTGIRDVRNTGESAPLQPVGITWECIEACATQFDVLQEERLWNDMRPDDTVAPTSGAEAVQTLSPLMELFGLGTFLESNGRCGRRKGRRGGMSMATGALLTSVQESRDTFAPLRQFILRGWREQAARQPSWQQAGKGKDGRSVASAVGVSNREEEDAREVEGHVEVDPDGLDLVATPSPSEILTASSIRMMLSMARTMRRTQPQVLEVVCGTMLEVLLEMPPLALAPLRHNPRSLEASTFHQVGKFCAEMMDSVDPSERTHALGLYLALAVSRGTVSGLLEAVRCLLDRSGRAHSTGQREAVASVDERSSSAAGAGAFLEGTRDETGNARPGSNELFTHLGRSPQGLRIATVLERLANHRVDALLSFPGERDKLKVVVKVPAHHAEGDAHVRAAQFRKSSSSPGSAQERFDELAWGDDASVATDGKFVYAWHPDCGLIKAQTGLRGTVKGKLCAENAGAGRLDTAGPLVVALPDVAGPSPETSRRGDKVKKELTLLMRSQDDELSLRRAGELEGWREEGRGGAKDDFDGVQPRRLVIHYSWRGVHDVESFSEKDSLRIPTARVREERARSRGAGDSPGSFERSDGADSTGREGPASSFRLLFASFLTFEETVGMFGNLFGVEADRGEPLSGSFYQLIRDFLADGQTDPFQKREGKGDSFLGVIGDRAYLRPGGCLRRGRFFVFRTCDLAMEGLVDAPALVTSRACLTSPACSQSRRTSHSASESKLEDEQHEKTDSPAVTSWVGEEENRVEFSPHHVPVCSDGQLVYALVPMESTGEPSIVAMDPAEAWIAVRPAVGLRPPRVTQQQSARIEHAGESSSVDGSRPSTREGEASKAAVGGDAGSQHAGAKWPWWRNGGAIPGVCICSNGDRLIVYWRADAESGAGPGSASIEQGTSSRAGMDTAGVTQESPRRRDSGCSGVVDVGDTAGSDDTYVEVVIRAARFQVSTGDCEAVEEIITRASRRCRGPPPLAYDPSSNLTLSCSLHGRTPESSPVSSGESNRGNGPGGIELRFSLSRNHGLRPGKVDEGPFGWRGALRDIAAVHPYHAFPSIRDQQPSRKSEESGVTAPEVHELARTAVFVLAHLDRTGAHCLGWSGGGKSESNDGHSSLSGGGHKSGPFCFDLSPVTFELLLGLVEKHREEPILAPAGGQGSVLGSQEHLRMYVLCASLRLLRVNIGVLLSRGHGVTEFGGEALRRRLLRSLFGLIDVSQKSASCSEDGSGIETFPSITPDITLGQELATTEAVRLLVEGLDLFYPTPRGQARLLTSYLRAYCMGKEALGWAACVVTLELLSRAASPRFLRNLQCGDDSEEEDEWHEEERCPGPGLYPGDLVSLDSDVIGGLSSALLELATVQATRNVQGSAGARLTPDEAGNISKDSSSGVPVGSLGPAVLKALASVLEVRTSAVVHVAQPLAGGGSHEKGSAGLTPGVDKDAVDNESKSLLDFVLSILRAADRILTASLDDSTVLAADSLREGVVGSLLPSALAAASTLLDEILHNTHGGYRMAETESLIEGLREPLVNIVQRLSSLTGSWSRVPCLVDVDEASVSCSTKGGGTFAAKGESLSDNERCRGCAASLPGGEDSQVPGVPSTARRAVVMDPEEQAQTESRCKISVSSPGSWLLRLQILCAALGASMVCRWVRGEPHSPEEKANAKWLEHPLLLHAGMQSVRPRGAKSLADVSGAGGRSIYSPDAERSSVASKTTLSSAAESTMGSRVSSLSITDSRAVEIDRLPMDGERSAAAMSGAALLDQLCLHPMNESARALAEAMKRAVPEDQGREQNINEAVWAAAAAVVHHAGLAQEAMWVAQAEIEGRKPSAMRMFGGASRGDPSIRGGAVWISPALIRAWRSAQRVRSWLLSGLSRGHEKSHLRARASFLLLLEPWALTQGRGQSERVPSTQSACRPIPSLAIEDDPWGSPGQGVRVSHMASELVLQFLLWLDDSGETLATGPGAEASKTLTGRSAAHFDAGDPAALLRIIELRSVRAACRAKGFLLATRLIEKMGSYLAVTEVLRAAENGLRVACLELNAADFLDASGCKPSGDGHGKEGARVIGDVGEEYGFGNTAVGSPSPPAGDQDGSPMSHRLHYLVGVYCCDKQSRTVLVDAVTKFLTGTAQALGREDVLGGEDSGCDPQPPPPGGPIGQASAGCLRTLRVQALRAVCLDYGRDDHDVLHQSGLLPRVVELLDSSDPMVAAAASEMMSEFCYCATATGEADDVLGKQGGGIAGDGIRGGVGIIADGMGMLRATPTRAVNEGMGLGTGVTVFQKAFLHAVRNRVRSMGDAQRGEMLAVSSRPRTLSTLATAASVLPKGGRALLERSLRLCSEREGLVVPHFALGEQHTLSLWVYVPPGTARPGVEKVGDSEGAPIAAQQSPRSDAPLLYVVVHGANCVVRQTPDSDSEVIGTLNEGEDVEIVPAEPRWQTHPLVMEGGCVRVAWPLSGYASRYTQDRRVLLRPHPHARRVPGAGEPYGDRAGSVRQLDAGPASAEVETTSSTLRGPPCPSSPSVDLDMETAGTNKVDEVGVAGTRRANVPPRGGGILLFKGNEVLLGEGDTDTWNRLGIEVTESRALRFFVGEGNSPDAVVSSAEGVLAPHAHTSRPGPRASPRPTQGFPRVPDSYLVAPGWFHVAVVQKSSEVSLFLDGRSCGIGSLPSRLLGPFRSEYRVMTKEVESVHPYPNSADDTWEVHIPGATGITVRFDPRSRTQPEEDFVRFYKDHTRTKTWGLDKYHGGHSGTSSNWPGVDIPPLEISADFFVVHFHSGSSSNDFGFRLTAEGRQRVPLPARARHGDNASRVKSEHDGDACKVGDRPVGRRPHLDMSPWPLYLGQPPAHASYRRTLEGGVLASVRLWDRPLTAEEVAGVAGDPPAAARIATRKARVVKTAHRPPPGTDEPGIIGSKKHEIEGFEDSRETTWSVSRNPTLIAQTVRGAITPEGDRGEDEDVGDGEAIGAEQHSGEQSPLQMVRKGASSGASALQADAFDDRSRGSTYRVRGSQVDHDSSCGASTAAQALALAHASCRSMFGRKELSEPDTTRSLLRLVLHSEAEKRAWALRVCQATLPWVDPRVVDDQFRIVVQERDSSFHMSFLESFLLLVGRIADVWGSFDHTAGTNGRGNVHGTGPKGNTDRVEHAGNGAVTEVDMLAMIINRGHRAICARISAREAFSLASEVILLVHKLTEGPRGAEQVGVRDGLSAEGSNWRLWADEVAKVTCAWLDRASPVVLAIQKLRKADEKMQWAQATGARQRGGSQGGSDGGDERVVVEGKGCERATRGVPGSSLKAAAPLHRSEEGSGDVGGNRVERPCDLRGALDSSSVDDLDRVVAALCLLGGHFEGLYVGSKVVCTLPPEVGAPGTDVERNSPGMRGRSLHSRQGGSQPSGRANTAGRGLEEATVISLGLSPEQVPQPVEDYSGRSTSRFVHTEGRYVDRSDAESPGGHTTIDGADSSQQQPHARLVEVGSPDSVNDGVRSARAGASAGSALPSSVRERDPLDMVGQGQQEQQEREDQRERQVQQDEAHGMPAGVVTPTLENFFGSRNGSDALEGLPSGVRNATSRSDSDPRTTPAAAFRSTGPAPITTEGSPDDTQEVAFRDERRVRDELVTVAISPGGLGGAPRTATLSMDDVTLQPSGVPQSLARALGPHTNRFLPHLRVLMQAETIFRGPSYLPLKTVSDLKRVVESAHPYRPGEDHSWSVVIEGAESIEVSFDLQSRFSRPGDQLILSWRTPWGTGGHRRLSPCSPEERRSEQGSAGDDGGSEGQAWPGVNGVAPLTVIAEAVNVRFIAAPAEGESSAARDPGAWGFRLIASGREVKRSVPPRKLPSLERAMLCDLRTRAVKSVAALMRHDEVGAGLAPLVSDLTRVALGSVPQVDVGAGQRVRALESAHPYENGTSESFHVNFKGASKLSVAFDPKSRTETNCDYLVFYKDANHLERWGELRYSGRDGAENWPGCGHRPPLEVGMRRLRHPDFRPSGEFPTPDAH